MQIAFYLRQGLLKYELCKENTSLNNLETPYNVYVHRAYGSPIHTVWLQGGACSKLHQRTCYSIWQLITNLCKRISCGSSSGLVGIRQYWSGCCFCIPGQRKSFVLKRNALSDQRAYDFSPAVDMRTKSSSNIAQNSLRVQLSLNMSFTRASRCKSAWNCLVHGLHELVGCPSSSIYGKMSHRNRP